MVIKRKRRIGQFQRATRPRTAAKKRPLETHPNSWLLKKANVAHPGAMPEAMYELFCVSLG